MLSMLSMPPFAHMLGGLLAGVWQTGHLLMQPRCARCMRMLLRIRMMTHSLPNVLAGVPGFPVPSACAMASGAVCMLFDEWHFVYCHSVCAGCHPALFGRAHITMQLFMWHHDSVWAAHYTVLMCTVALKMFLMML